MRNNIHITPKSVSLKIGVVFFEEDGCMIAYCPSLDLSGYGVTTEEAKKDFEFVLKNYLSEQIENGTLREDLVHHGWNLKKDKALEPTIVEIAQTNKHFVRITENQYSKRNLQFSQPCFA